MDPKTTRAPPRRRTRADARAAGEAEALPEPAGDGDDQPVSSLSSAASTPTGRRPSPDARSTPPGRPAASEAATLGGSLALWRALDGAGARRAATAAPPPRARDADAVRRGRIVPELPREPRRGELPRVRRPRDDQRRLADLGLAPERGRARAAPRGPGARPRRRRRRPRPRRGSPTRTAADAEAARGRFAPRSRPVRLLGHDDADVAEHAAGCLAAVAQGSDARRDAARTRAPSRRSSGSRPARPAPPPRPPPARSPSSRLTGRSGGAKPI
ncbi:hypothetical protein JL720_6854 [Aureococcus anophagefferens]|nr:hypothetical protein JL720_6854 [Aureococcus anophagefferens]